MTVLNPYVHFRNFLPLLSSFVVHSNLSVIQGPSMTHCNGLKHSALQNASPKSRRTDELLPSTGTELIGGYQTQSESGPRVGEVLGAACLKAVQVRGIKIGRSHYRFLRSEGKPHNKIAHLSNCQATTSGGQRR